MLISLTTPFATLSSIFRSRAALQLENLALRHQIGVLQRSARKHLTLTPDRLLWVWMSRVWSGWRSALAIVQPHGHCLASCWLSPFLDLEGPAFRGQVRDMGIHEVLCTPRSPWQRAYVERVIGSIRRECLDHVLVFHVSSLRRILRSYLITITDRERIYH